MALQLWPFAEIHNNFHKIHLLCFLHVILHVLHKSSSFKMKYKRDLFLTMHQKCFYNTKLSIRTKRRNRRCLPSGFEIKARASHEESIPNQTSCHFYFLKRAV